MAIEAKQRKRPSASREMQIEKLVEDVSIGDEVLEIYGPMRMAGSVVWELWVYDKHKELATRFVEELPGGVTRVHDTFAQLAVEIDMRHGEILNQASKDEWAQKKEIFALQTQSGVVESKTSNERYAALVPLALAAVGFVSAISVFAIIALRGGDEGKYAAWFMFGTIIASACTFIFGRTIFPRAKSLFGA